MSFSTAVKYSVGGSGPSAVVIADVNKDNRPDLIAVNSSSNNLAVLLGNGDGTFQPATTYSAGTNTPISLAVGDFDKDGNLDVVTANVTGSTVSILLGNGTGGFSAAVNFATGSLPYAVGVGDFDKDGNLDLVTANSGANNISLLKGTGTGAFGTASNFAVGSSPQSLVIGDFNKDNLLDVATANYNSANLSVLLNNGTAFSPAISYSVGTNPIQLVSADFNGDGYPDLASANYGSSNTSLLLGSANGSFSAAINFNVNQTTLIAGDFNLDGLVDLTVSTLYSTNLGILTNNAASSFNQPVFFPVGANPYALASADLNGDNKPDLVTVNNSSNNLSVLLNTTVPPSAKISVLAGSPQSTLVGSAFSTNLKVKVVDQTNNPVSGADVTFSAPIGAVPSGTFPGSVLSATVKTGADGTATAPILTANCRMGNFQLTADVNGAATPAYFSLTNTVGSPAGIVTNAGTPQSAVYNTTFITPLKALVRDSCNNPISGATVVFNAPGSGASGTFAGGSTSAIVTTDSSGIATAPSFSANSILGTYTVGASVIGFSTAGTANFNLTNKAGAPTTLTVLANTTPQSAVVNTAFGTALGVTVADVDGHPVSGVGVNFIAPGNGASGTFAGGSSSVSITTNASGIASAPTFTANCRAGSYSVTASVSNLNTSFSLTNTSGSPASLVVVAGSGQRALINTAFATNFKAVVRDSCGNGLSGLNIQLVAPGSGASGSFAGGGTSLILTTDSLGQITAPAFTANTITGSYSVTGNVVGFTVAGTVDFGLANLPTDYGDYGPGSYQVNPAHNGVVNMPNFALPLQRRWTVLLDGDYGFVTYPVVAEHKVFVLSSTPNMGYGNRLWALDVNTGQTVWGPVNINHVYYWGALAYDNGRVFVMDENGNLTAFDSSNGSFLWRTSTGGNDTPPVAINGLVYVGRAGWISAYRATDGNLVWSKTNQYVYGYGAVSSMIASDDGVYIAGACQKVYKFQFYDGAPLWSYDPGCPYEGLDGTLYDNKLYIRAGSNPPGLVLNALNGTYLGNWLPTGLLPTFSGNVAFIVNSNGKLEGRDASSGNLLWTKSLQNGSFSVSPVVINGVAYVGANDGNIYAYDTNGNLQWQIFTGAPNGVGDYRIISGLGAGEGLLLVPTGRGLVALESISGTPHAGFDSNPAPGSTLSLGSTRLATTLSSTLTITETGQANLVVSNPSFSGANPTEFALTGATFPLTLVDGAVSQNLTLSCTPQKGGSRSATLTLTTNDPAHPTVSYQLSCSGTLVVVNGNDNGTGNTPGTLSYYLTNQRAGPGQTISFALSGTSTINVKGALPSVPTGVSLDGGSCSTPITLDGSQASGATRGLVLQGQNQLKALRLLHFPGQQLLANSRGNRLLCISTRK